MQNQKKKPGKMKAYARRLIVSLGVNAFVWLMLLFFSPSEVFAGNASSFDFGYDSVWVPMLCCALGLTVILSLVESLLPRRLWRFLTQLTFAGGLCCYAQSAFMNGSMPTLAGGTEPYDQTLVITNIAIWAAIVVAVFVAVAILHKKAKMLTVMRGLAAVSAVLVLMQGVGLASMLPAMPVRDTANVEEASKMITTDQQLTLSSKQNTVVFIFDTMAQGYIDRALKEDPALFENLDGFTYYPDMVSTYSRTFPSITYLLTNEAYLFDMPYRDWVHSAFEQSTFLDKIKEKGVSLALYTSSKRLGKSILPELVNYGTVEGSDREPSTVEIIKNMLTVSLYRNTPYIVKENFMYNVNTINADVLGIPEKFVASTYENILHNAMVNQDITLTDEPGAFRFYHLYGAHPGTKLTAEGFIGEEKTSVAEAVRGDMAILRSYIEELKKAGIYDKTTIIVTADHGSSGGNSDTLDLPGVASTLLLVKPAGATGETIVSTAPISHADLFATIYESFGLDGSEYGRTVYDIAEGEQRERLYYYTALYTDKDGEVALREYAVNGDARNLENYTPTGNWWDIQYSQNRVSEQSFDGQ